MTASIGQTRPWTPSGTAARVMLVASAVLAVAFFHYFAPQRGDDSFIFYRIADNLAHGAGPVFNLGERVEAYSSPLWLAVLGVARACGADPITFSRLSGWFFVAATFGLTYRLARLLGASDRLAALAVLLTCLSGSLWYWAPAGLETAMYVALFVWAATTLARGASWEWAAATALIGVARPEGLVLGPLSVAGVWFAQRKLPAPRLLALALGVPVAYFAFRLAYFHWPFPNTYYAKATGRLDKRISRGTEYALWVIVVTLTACGVAFVRVLRGGDRRPLVVALFAAALLCAVVFGGGDWMWGKRLALPCVPVALALAAYVARVRVRFAVQALVLAGLALVLQNDDLPWPDRKDYERFFCFEALGPTLKEPRRALHLRFGRPLETIADALLWKQMPEGARLEGTMTVVARDVADYMVAHYAPGTLTAVNHAGAVPFYTRFPVIDMTGLADAHIAHSVHGGLHEKYDERYVLSREPGLVVLNSRTRPTPEQWYVPNYWEGETALVQDPEFARHYRPVPRYWSWHWADGYTSYILLYERRGP